MVWHCAACTFENRDDIGSRCEICETDRGKAVGEESSHVAEDKQLIAKDERGGKKQLQSTLFGGIAKPAEKPTRKSKKREAPKDESIAVVNKLPFSHTGKGVKNASLEIRQERSNQVLADVFKIAKLRKLQPKAVDYALRGISQIVVMATGGGKSLCYQLPAVVLGGTSIVVSPLIALMEDQVQALIGKGVGAAVISSSNGERQNVEIMERLVGRSLRARGKLTVPLKPVTLVYVTPEQVQTDRFRSILTEMHKESQLSLFAVDEAHCLSSWGHDFRPAYRRLNWFREQFPNVPCMACTATATPKVIQDIQATLLLKDAPCHIGSFDRDNILYKVRYKDSLDATTPIGAMGDLVQFVKRQHERAAKAQNPCSGIVYVHKREDTTMLARQINQGCGVVAAAYHGGLKDAERTRVQKAWTQGEIKIVIATVAFGMGIDLSHVRYVVHWSLAKSVEAFYQESGRAGRDGLPSTSLLYFSRQDASKFEYLLRQRKTKKEHEALKAQSLEALNKMVDYCMTPACRRVFLLKHFGERNLDSGSVCQKSCDYCWNPKKVREAIDSASASSDYSFQTKLASEKFMGKDDEFDDPFGESHSAWDVDGLGITGRESTEDWLDSTEQHRKPAAKSVERVSSILEKYEAIECSQTQRNGFVKFKAKDEGETKPLVVSTMKIPEHLRKQLPNPLAQFDKKKPSDETKKSADYASDIQRLRDEIAKARSQSSVITNTLGSGRSRPPPPPPPPVSFSQPSSRHKTKRRKTAG